MSSTVPTAAGDIPVAELGATLMHEHVFVRNQEIELNWPHPEADDEHWMNEAITSFTRLRAKGVSTIVDLTVVGLGRDVTKVAELAAQVPVNIVVATGLYSMRDLPSYFKNRGPESILGGDDPLTGLFRTDVVDGIAGTGVRAGIIKVATDSFGITPDVARVLDAAATVANETGVPISTHTSAEHRTGLDQIVYFRARGVAPEQLIIGHSGDSTDLAYLREMLDQGVTLGMDRFGVDSFIPGISQSDEQRAQLVARLVKEGYAAQMVLSHDAAIFSINSHPSARARIAPNWTHHRISDWVLPQLQQLGVSEADVAQMMVRNPARLLASR